VDRHTALIVVVPEAEPVVRHHRAVLDRFFQCGVPAHVTVVHPFVPLAEVDCALLDRLAAMFATVPAFDYRFVRTQWFSTDVLYLAPDDDRGFRGLTRLAVEEFPDHPPYGGAFLDTVPHLTVGHHQPLEALREAERQVVEGLPVAGRAEVVTLLAQSASGQWSVRSTFALGRVRPHSAP